MTGSLKDQALAGKVAFVAGGSSGINLGVAQAFARAGAKVTLISRSAEKIAAAAQTITDDGHEALGIAADVRDYAAVEAALAQAAARFGKIDIVVNNAGTSRTGAFEEITDEVWRDDFDQKLFAAIRLTRLVWPQMKARRWGRVINTLNIGAKAPRARSATPLPVQP